MPNDPTTLSVDDTTPAPDGATPDPHELIFGGFEASTEFEAHIMTEAANVLHRRLGEELDALPWWRFGARRGLHLALVTTGGACYEWAADADRLADAALDTSEMHGLLAGLDRRNGEGLRSGGKIGLTRARGVEECYTCEVLNREVAGPHEHPFEDLVAAERAERDRWPRRSKALWELVSRARALGPQPSEPTT